MTYTFSECQVQHQGKMFGHTSTLPRPANSCSLSFQKQMQSKMDSCSEETHSPYEAGSDGAWLPGLGRGCSRLLPRKRLVLERYREMGGRSPCLAALDLRVVAATSSRRTPTPTLPAWKRSTSDKDFWSTRALLTASSCTNHSANSVKCEKEQKMPPQNGTIGAQDTPQNMLLGRLIIVSRRSWKNSQCVERLSLNAPRLPKDRPSKGASGHPSPL